MSIFGRYAIAAAVLLCGIALYACQQAEKAGTCATCDTGIAVCGDVWQQGQPRPLRWQGAGWAEAAEAGTQHDLRIYLNPTTGGISPLCLQLHAGQAMPSAGSYPLDSTAQAGTASISCDGCGRVLAGQVQVQQLSGHTVDGSFELEVEETTGSRTTISGRFSRLGLRLLAGC